MIKNKDVVVDRRGRIFQVVDADYRTDRLGKQILCRLYRSQKRFAFMPWQVKKHPFFAWFKAKQTQNFLHLTLDKTLKLSYIIHMIKIEKNENFKGFLNIFVGGFLFDQVQSRATALKIAKKLAKERKEDGFSFLGFPMLTKEK